MGVNELWGQLLGAKIGAILTKMQPSTEIIREISQLGLLFWAEKPAQVNF